MLFAARPVALDTVVKIVKTILANPGELKYRRLKWSNKRFRAEVKDAPGATDYLKGLGFVDEGEALFLRSPDEALLLTGMQLLEQERGHDSHGLPNERGAGQILRLVLEPRRPLRA